MARDIGKKQSRAVTDKAIQLYWWLLRMWVVEGCIPSVREAQEALGVASSSTAGRYLGLLKQWGWIKRVKRHGVRDIQFTRASEVGLSAEQIASLYGWDV